MNKIHLTKEQYFPITKSIDYFWLDKEQINEYLTNSLNEPQNDYEKFRINALRKWILFYNKRCHVSVIHEEDYSYWLKIFELMRKERTSLEVGKICCQLRGIIYDYLESEDSKFMNQKNSSSVHLLLTTTWIKLKLSEAVEKLCNSCSQLVNNLDKHISKWNKENRLYLPYDERFE